MKCLLLAAGRGTRISRYLPNRPKCTIDVGGISLIKRTVNMLQENGVTDISLCLGYRQEVIRDELDGLGCNFFYNPFYDVTNSVASAWFSKDIFKDDNFIIMNADVYLDEELMQELVDFLDNKQQQNSSNVYLFMDSSRIKEADYKFFCEDGILKRYGKELLPDETSGEYIGAAILRKEFLPQFTQKLSEMIAQQNHSVWWENVIYELSEKNPVPVIDVKGKFWAEVDYIEDYERIMEKIKKKKGE